MATIVIAHADWLITVDRQRRVLSDGAVAIEKDRILEVGKSQEVLSRHQGGKLFDARGKIVLPGLVNAHARNARHLARGLADTCRSQESLDRRLDSFEAALDPEAALLSALVCQLEMIKSGTTCFIDAGDHFPAETAAATIQSGMRGIISRSAANTHVAFAGEERETLRGEDADMSVAHVEEAIARWHGAESGRLRVWASLRSLPGAPDRLVVAAHGLVKRHGVGIQAAAAISLGDQLAHLDRHGCREIERLERLGVLDDRWLLIHTNWLSPGEMDLLAAHGSKVALCPGAGLKGGRGTFSRGRFPEMWERGICVCLGTDSAPSGNSLDLVRAMYLAAAGFKDARIQADVLSAEAAVEMATLNGSRAALMSDEIGSLEAGKKADLCLWDIDRPEWRPVFSPVSNLVYAADGSSADTVIVDGTVLMENKVLKSLDEHALLSDALPVARRVAERAGVPAHGSDRWPIT